MTIANGYLLFSFFDSIRNDQIDVKDIRLYLCIKAMISAARPEPSHTTTGTGGSSVTYSRTDRTVFVPPSITNATTGILLCVSIANGQTNEKINISLECKCVWVCIVYREQLTWLKFQIGYIFLKFSPEDNFGTVSTSGAVIDQ